MLLTVLALMAVILLLKIVYWNVKRRIYQQTINVRMAQYVKGRYGV